MIATVKANMTKQFPCSLNYWIFGLGLGLAIVFAALRIETHHAVKVMYNTPLPEHADH